MYGVRGGQLQRGAKRQSAFVHGNTRDEHRNFRQSSDLPLVLASLDSTRSSFLEDIDTGLAIDSVYQVQNTG